MRTDKRTQIVGESMIDVAKKAKPVVLAALLEMLTRSRRLRPFAILEDVATGKFVQWYGSEAEGLKFDVPAAHIIAEPAPDVEKSVERGLEVLSQLVILPNEMPFADGVLLIEQDTHDSSLLV